MGSVTSILTGDRAISLIALAMLCALVWFGGEKLGWDQQTRLLIIGAIITLALFVLIVQRMLAVRGARKIENQLRAQAQAQMESTTPDKQPEIEALEKQFQEALGALKGSKMGSTALYTLPWYIIIGPPGAGKSTALQESGLNFPSIGAGPKSIRGIGGTRNCDWWFTDEGILLDTAGRYTTQAEDQQEWFAFLELLKRSRKHKPINGAIVAVAVPDLVSASPEEIETYSQTIRERLDELTKQLELVFPVYLMFTKCDLLSGFNEFYEDFGRPERSQVWGFSLPYAGSAGRDCRKIFEEETALLSEKLRLRRLTVLANDRPVKKKQSGYSFPLQFERARNPLAEFVGALFKPNPFQESAVLRGVYFSSGTQKGIPIDQVLAAMGAAFQMSDEAADMQQSSVDKKSYFLKDLFTRVIFPDENLARSSTSVQRRQRLVRGVTAFGSIGAFIVLLAYLVTAFVGNQALIAGTKSAIEKTHESEREGTSGLDQLKAMDGLRSQLSVVDGYRRNGLPLTLGFGMYRGDDAAGPARKLYFERVKALLLNDCTAAITKEVDALTAQADKKSPDYERLYDLHRTWKLLTGELKPDADSPALIERTLKVKGRWDAGLADASPEAEALAQKQLEFMTTRLEFVSDWKIPYDAGRDQRVSDELTGALWIPQSYAAIINAKRDAYPTVDGNYLLKGAAGKDLVSFGATFSGIYTQKAWDEYVAFAIKDQSKVLADKFSQLKADKKASDIEERLREQYATEYRRAWDGLIDGVGVVKFADCQDAVNKLKALSGLESPYPALFKAIWDGRMLRISDTDVRNRSSDDLKWVADALKAIDGLAGEIGILVNNTKPKQRVIPYLNQGKLKTISDAFDKSSRDLEIALKASDMALGSRALGVLNGVCDAARDALRSEAQSEANALWQDTVGVAFRDMATKFPFDETSLATRQDVPMAAFVNLFNPKNGVFWTTWATLDKLDDVVIGKALISYSADFNVCLQKAQEIRDTMFKRDGDALSVPIGIRFDGSPGVADIRFALAGNKEVGLNERPDRRFDLTWTDGPGMGAKLSIRVGDNQWVPNDFSDKPWGLLRLLRKGTVTDIDNVTFVTTWTFSTLVAGKTQTYDVKLTFIRTDANNPLKANYFSEFVPPPKVGP